MCVCGRHEAVQRLGHQLKRQFGQRSQNIRGRRTAVSHLQPQVSLVYQKAPSYCVGALVCGNNVLSQSRKINMKQTFFLGGVFLNSIKPIFSQLLSSAGLQAPNWKHTESADGKVRTVHENNTIPCQKIQTIIHSLTKKHQNQWLHIFCLIPIFSYSLLSVVNFEMASHSSLF